MSMLVAAAVVIKLADIPTEEPAPTLPYILIVLL